MRPFFALIIFCLFLGIANAQTIDIQTINSRKQIPILCYHQIRNWRAGDKERDKDYIIPPATFKAHMKMLADSGYHTILPDELYAYLTKGTELPAKPIMLTFDDTDGDGYTEARPEMMKYGFKSVYFITTTNILKNKHYLDFKQIKQLSEEGNVIGNHTFDHSNFKKFKGSDWELQIDKPNKKLEAITDKPVKYFAFPFGVWSAQNLPQLHQRGFLAAFQLSEPRDPNDPLMTIRRILDCGYWSAATLDYNIKHDFGKLPKKPAAVTAQVK